ERDGGTGLDGWRVAGGVGGDVRSRGEEVGSGWRQIARRSQL
ncbi:MAG: hypothetical protein AVDCRST_MAG71-2504, partial [uncultured Lysobacter sp.]